MKLPKGMKKLTKADFSKEMMLYQVDQHIPFAFEKKEYIDWVEKKEEKSTKKTYRW